MGVLERAEHRASVESPRYVLWQNTPVGHLGVHARVLAAGVSINGNMLTCHFFFLHSFDFIFCLSEINPYFFCNKKSDAGNFIGREIKVSHIEFTGPYEANGKENKSMLGMWLVKSP